MPPQDAPRGHAPSALPAGVVAYFRVSTDRQGRSGLGLEAQREAVMQHVAAIGGRLLVKFTEVESGRRSDRSRLAAALACGALLAATLMAPEPGACSGVHRPLAA